MKINEYILQDNRTAISINYWKLNPHWGNGNKATEKKTPKELVILFRLRIGHVIQEQHIPTYLKQSSNQRVMHARLNIL